MTGRKSRSRKTAERMAGYKAVANRTACRQTTAPTRVSPRTSPRKKMSNVGHEEPKKKELPSDNQMEGHNTAEVENTRESGVRKTFDDLEKIPETPPRPPRSIRNKRVLAPKRNAASSSGLNDYDSGDESEMPSKKRRIFKTPIRGQGRPTSNDERSVDQNGGTTEPSQTDDILTPSRNEIERLDVSDVGESPCVQPPASHSAQRRENIMRHPIFQNEGHRILTHNRSRLNPASCKTIGGTEMRSVHPPSEKDDLQLLSVSTATVSRMFDAFGTKLVSEVTVLQRENIEAVKKIADALSASVSSQVQHLEGIFTMLTRGMTGLRTQNGGGKTTLTEWEHRLNSLTSDIEVVFNKDVLGRILCYNSSVKAVSVYQSHGGSDVKRASLSAQTLLFSLQPGEKKFSFCGQVGTLHSEFKFTTVQNAFFNLSRNSFGFFTNSDNSSEVRVGSSCSHESAVSLGISTGRSLSSAGDFKQIKRPVWLEKGKVNADHINEARSFLESANQSRKSKVRRTPGPDDIAIHAALRAYRLLGNYLHVRRGAVRNKFFQGLGYLLVSWSEHVKDNQRDLKMSWYSGDNELGLNLDSIPYTEQCNINADEAVITSVDANNKMLLRRLFSESPGMILAVEHQVHVVNGSGTQRRHVGGEVSTIHRMINLIDVACSVCVEYCGVSSVEVFLRAHKHSLRSVMIFALLFKAFCVRFMECRENAESSAARSEGERKAIDLMDVTVGGMNLKDLIPGPSMQKNLLECRCLRMTRSEFDIFNVVEVHEDQRASGEGGSAVALEMMEIVESEEMGIGMM